MAYILPQFRSMTRKPKTPKHYSAPALFALTMLLCTQAQATVPTVPEPGTASLLGLGALAAVLAIRLFRK